VSLLRAKGQPGPSSTPQHQQFQRIQRQFFLAGGLIQATNDTLYGTTSKGGTSSGRATASGVIYTISGLHPR